MKAPGEDLASILRVERIGPDEFGARLESFWGSSQIGDVLARAVLAAGATCTGELLALHGVLVRPAPPGAPLRLAVERVHDGPGDALRAVRVHGDALLCHALLRFGARGDGPSHQDLAPPAGLGAPERLPSTAETAAAEGWADYAHGPLEFRRAGAAWPGPADGEARPHCEWLLPRKGLSEGARLHEAASVFAFAFYAQWAFERRIGARFDYERFAPFACTLNMHRTARFDDWRLLVATNPVSAGGRALGARELYARDGSLVASGALEARTALR